MARPYPPLLLLHNRPRGVLHNNGSGERVWPHETNLHKTMHLCTRSHSTLGECLDGFCLNDGTCDVSSGTLACLCVCVRACVHVCVYVRVCLLCVCACACPVCALMLHEHVTLFTPHAPFPLQVPRGV